jgi:nucleotidyltransferase/DNA polymerase involved in DNA repair
MKIACISLPRFAVEAERQRRKDIGSRLVLVGDNTVWDCSLGAEVMKVRRGMRMSEAIGLCPKAVVLPADYPYYERLFGEVLDLLEMWTPDVESGGVGTAFCGLDGLPALPQRWGEDVVGEVHKRFGLMPAVGIADGKFPSRVAAAFTRAGAVKIIAKGDEARFLAPLSIEHLPASDAMRWRLGMLGISTIGEVARLPIGAIQAQFGPEGVLCWELAQGRDSQSLQPRVLEQTIVRRMQLPAAASSVETIMMAVEKLLHACYAGTSGGRWVRKAVVRGALDRGGSWDLPVTFQEALHDPKDAWFTVKNAILRHPPERPVEELEVELIGLGGESGKQAVMFEGKGKLWRQVEEAVRQLEASDEGQTEAPAIGRVVPLEPWSRIPERRAALAELPSTVDGKRR